MDEMQARAAAQQAAYQRNVLNQQPAQAGQAGPVQQSRVSPQMPQLPQQRLDPQAIIAQMQQQRQQQGGGLSHQLPQPGNLRQGGMNPQLQAFFGGQNPRAAMAAAAAQHQFGRPPGPGTTPVNAGRPDPRQALPGRPAGPAGTMPRNAGTMAVGTAPRGTTSGPPSNGGTPIGSPIRTAPILPGAQQPRPVQRKAGGAVPATETKGAKRLDRYARGGSVKPNTRINIIVAPGGKNEPAPPPEAMAPPPPAPGPMPPPAPPPMPDPAAAAAPPPMPPLPGGLPLKPPGMKSGGRVPRMTAGAGSGEGRIEKAIAARRDDNSARVGRILGR